MSKITITAVGVSGSGKSNAFDAIRRLLFDGTRNGYYLVAGGEELEERQSNFKLITNYVDAEANDDFVSTGTMGAAEFLFAFGNRANDDLPSYPLVEVPYIDYPGGALQINTLLDRNESGAQEIMYRIMDTDVLLLFADANILCEPQKYWERIAKDINRLFTYLSTERDSNFANRPRTVCLLLTKCDSELIPEKLRANNFRGLINNALIAFGPTVEFCSSRSKWNFAVMPTSACGNGNSKTERLGSCRYKSEVVGPAKKPYGFDIAILYGIMCELGHRIAGGDTGEEPLPDEQDSRNGAVNWIQWQYIKRVQNRVLQQKQMELFRLYEKDLHKLLDPLDGTEYIANKLKGGSNPEGCTVERTED